MKRTRRPYQTVALAVQKERRVVGYYWTRRGRKSTTAGDIYFQEMSAAPGRTAINCSASLMLGKEAIGMTLTAIEQAEILASEAAAVISGMEANATENNLDFQIANSQTGKIYKGMSADDRTQLYQSRSMELRLYFDKSSYSRELILAPSVNTFRSFRALIGLDEFGYMPKSEAKDLINSADAMMRDTPDRKMLFFCNLCLDDGHPWFEMTMPREITEGSEEDQFKANASGHLYIGQTGMLVHRVALKDAYEAGHLLYDDEGKAMSYEQCRAFPSMRGGWDVSYALNHKPGGASVIDIIAMLTAQRRGVGKCSFVYADCDADFRQAMNLLRANLRDGRVGVGVDQASTTNETSNPTSITFTEQIGNESFQRLVLVFKTKRRVVRDELLKEGCAIVQARPHGGPVVGVGIDASNERLAAQETADVLMALGINCQLIISSNIVTPRPQGYSEQHGNVNYKTWLCDLYSARINDGRVATAPDEYLKSDHRLVMKDAGRVICVPDPTTGAHGDTFDSGKIAEFMLMNHGEPGPFHVFENSRISQIIAARQQRSIEG
jgi:hypothetical protein